MKSQDVLRIVAINGAKPESDNKTDEKSSGEICKLFTLTVNEIN